MNEKPSLRQRIGSWIAGVKLATVTATVKDTEGGWLSLSGRPHDYDASKIYDLYQDALTAWRKNPIAWRIIAIITDFVVGDSIKINSTIRRFNKFIQDFWNHPKNRMDLRLEPMCDELGITSNE